MGIFSKADDEQISYFDLQKAQKDALITEQSIPVNFLPPPVEGALYTEPNGNKYIYSNCHWHIIVK